MNGRSRPRRHASAGARGCGRRRGPPVARCRRQSGRGHRRAARTRRSARRTVPVDPGVGASRRSHDRVSARSRRDAGASPLPPGLDDGPTGAGAHAGAEPVPLGPAPVVGLERALHLCLLCHPACASRGAKRATTGGPERIRRRAAGGAPRVGADDTVEPKSGSAPTATTGSGLRSDRHAPPMSTCRSNRPSPPCGRMLGPGRDRMVVCLFPTAPAAPTTRRIGTVATVDHSSSPARHQSPSTCAVFHKCGRCCG